MKHMHNPSVTPPSRRSKSAPQPRSRRRFFTIVALCLLAAATRAGETKAPLGGIGFRYDGTGVCPPDWKPPADFNALTGHNLRWKAPLPNFSSSSPIAVGDRVFVVCMPGWPVGQDMAQLLCFDAVSGKELWRRNLDDLAGMPEPQYTEAKAVRRQYWELIVKSNRLRYEHKCSSNETRRAEISAELKDMGMAVTDNDSHWGSGRAESGLFKHKEIGQKLKNLLGYQNLVWGLTCMDANFPTPVSDGKRLFIYTGRRSVHAFDLDGRVLWEVRQPDATYPAHWTEDLGNEALYVENKFLVHCYDHLWAYDADTGKLLWKVASPYRFRHGMGSPALLQLKRPDHPGQTDMFVYTWTGDLARVRDGKLMQNKVIYPHFPSMTTDRAETLFISTMKPGCVESRQMKAQPQIPPLNGSIALRFAYDGPETVSWKRLWHNERVNVGADPIYLDERLLAGSGALDARTGGLVVPGGSYSRGILAGGYFYGRPDSGVGAGSGGAGGLGTLRDCYQNVTVLRHGITDSFGPWQCPVELLPAHYPDPEKQAQLVAMTGLDRHRDSYGWHGGWTVPAAGGNRLYLRTYNNLYCFDHLVNGGTNDNPKVVAAIRAETGAVKLAAHLGDTCPQYRYEAARRLGALKQPLPSAAAGSLAKMVSSDAYSEVRAAAVLALDACDPVGAAGWNALGAALEAAWTKDEPTDPRVQLPAPQQVERRCLSLTIQSLGAGGEAFLARHWEAAMPIQRRGVLESAIERGLRSQTVLADALKCLADPKHRAGEPMRAHWGRSIFRYLNACDAAKDPAVADLLLKMASWELYPTLARHVPAEKLLAWIKPMALDRNNLHDHMRARFFDAWYAAGQAAIPAMKEVAAELEDEAAKLEGKDQHGQNLRRGYVKAIGEQIAKMEAQ